jgi:acyl carrier protein
MNQQNIFDDTISIIKAYAPDLTKEELTMDTIINTETAVDSLGFVLIISKLEGKYNIRIPDRQISKFITIGDVVKYISKKAS